DDLRDLHSFPTRRSSDLEKSGKPYEGAVALGCVIRGDTIHFEIVSHESARGLMEISRTRGVPIGNGILTVDNDAQAWMRARVNRSEEHTSELQSLAYLVC